MMNNKEQFDILQQATLLLLNCGDEIGVMKEALDRIYAVFASYSGVNTQNQNDEEIILASGKAISPAEAAQCLFDIKRTTKFISGINTAIKQRRLKNDDCIQILYAGCGPYATLVTPLLTLFDKCEISCDLLDVNEVSLKSAQEIIGGLGLSSRISQCFLEDASRIILNKDYDIVISETMQAALRSEPQVAIMQNLFPQMKSDAIFIPEEIIVEAKLNTRGVWNSESLKIENEERFDIGEVLRVNRETLTEGLYKKTFRLTKPNNEYNELKLYTSVKIVENEYLLEGDSGLTSPVKLEELTKIADCELEFHYNQNYPAQINFAIN